MKIKGDIIWEGNLKNLKSYTHIYFCYYCIQ